MAKRKRKSRSSKSNNNDISKVDKTKVSIDNSKSVGTGITEQSGDDINGAKEAEELIARVDPAVIELLTPILQQQRQFNANVEESLKMVMSEIQGLKQPIISPSGGNPGGKGEWARFIPQILQALLKDDSPPKPDEGMTDLYKGMFQAWVNSQKESFSLENDMRRARLKRLDIENEEREREAKEGWGH